MCIIFFAGMQTFASCGAPAVQRCILTVPRRGVCMRLMMFPGESGNEGRRSKAVSDLSQMTLAEMPAYTEQDTKVEKKAQLCSDRGEVPERRLFSDPGSDVPD